MSERRPETGPRRPARRRFLQAGGAIALASLGGLAGTILDLGGAGEPEPLACQLASLFRSPRKARALGRRYLALRPEAADRSALRARLGLADGSVAGASLRTRLAELRRRDFAQNRVVAIDGWILAQCEAELCALLSLG